MIFFIYLYCHLITQLFHKTLKIKDMKLKLTDAEVRKLLNEGKLENVSASDPWWVIVLKAVAYIIGLILAGYVTPTAVATATAALPFFINF